MNIEVGMTVKVEQQDGTECSADILDKRTGPMMLINDKTFKKTVELKIQFDDGSAPYWTDPVVAA